MAAEVFQRLAQRWEEEEKLFTQVWNTLLPSRSRELALEVARDLLKQRYSDKGMTEGVFFGLCPELAADKITRFTVPELMPKFIGARVGSQETCTQHDFRYILAQVGAGSTFLTGSVVKAGEATTEGDDGRSEKVQDLVATRQSILYSFLLDVITVVNKYIAQQGHAPNSISPHGAQVIADASLPAAIRFGGEYAAEQRRFTEESGNSLSVQDVGHLQSSSDSQIGTMANGAKSGVHHSNDQIDGSDVGSTPVGLARLVQGLQQMSIMCCDFAASKVFYTELLGLQIVRDCFEDSAGLPTIVLALGEGLRLKLCRSVVKTFSFLQKLCANAFTVSRLLLLNKVV